MTSYKTHTHDTTDTRASVLQSISYTRLAILVGGIVLAVVVVSLVVMRLVSGYWFWASEETRQEVLVARTVAAVSTLLVLPEDETPLVATIVDAAALQEEQSFYQGAENGDQLLIYGQSLRAILYSPERNIIVNVGPVQVPQDTPAATTTPERGAGAQAAAQQVSDSDAAQTLSDTVQVEVRNGSGTDGAARAFAETLDTARYLVLLVTDAAHTNYAQTLIVDRTEAGEHDTALAALASNLDAQVATALPEGEAPTTADVLVILGE